MCKGTLGAFRCTPRDWHIDQGWHIVALNVGSSGSRGFRNMESDAFILFRPVVALHDGCRDVAAEQGFLV